MNTSGSFDSSGDRMVCIETVQRVFLAIDPHETKAPEPISAQPEPKIT